MKINRLGISFYLFKLFLSFFIYIYIYFLPTPKLVGASKLYGFSCSERLKYLVQFYSFLLLA